MVYRDFQDFLLVAEFGDSPVENQEYIDALLSVSVRRIVHDAADFLVWDGTGAFMLHAKGIVPVFDFPEEGAENLYKKYRNMTAAIKTGRMSISRIRLILPASFAAAAVIIEE